MKILILLLLTTTVFAQDSQLKEQNRLLQEENKMLREEIKKLQTPTPGESQKLMNALMKGKKFQEEQNKALEELDKED